MRDREGEREGYSEGEGDRKADRKAERIGDWRDVGKELESSQRLHEILSAHYREVY